jgi:hypothetical protein
MSEIILFIAVIILAVINRLQAGSNYKKKFEIKVRLIEPKVKKKKDKLKSRVIERFEPEVEGYEAKENPYPSGKVEL